MRGCDGFSLKKFEEEKEEDGVSGFSDVQEGGGRGEERERQRTAGGHSAEG